jgi:hypothetical protein
MCTEKCDLFQAAESNTTNESAKLLGVLVNGRVKSLKHKGLISVKI